MAGDDAARLVAQSAARLKAFQLASQLEGLALEAGLVGFGISSSREYKNVRIMLEERDALGYRDTMEFTYRNPPRSSSANAVLAEAKSVITAALYYGDQGDEGLASASMARYAKSDNYGALRAKLNILAEFLQSQGYLARVALDSNAMIDKEAALRAGSGSYLKNSLIAIPRYGSMVVLGNVVTNAALIPSSRRLRLLSCGSCRRCIDACPTGAIRPGGAIDARRCISWVLQKPGKIPIELREAIATRVYGCDQCQDICPYNHAARELHPSPEVVIADLLAILEMSDEELLAGFSHLYLHKRDPGILRRNALLALANAEVTKVGDLQPLLATLERYRRSPDPVLAEQASYSSVLVGAHYGRGAR